MVEKVAGGYLVTGSSVDVLRASNFFDLFKAYDGTLASLESKPLSDAQTGLRPMIAARDAEQAPDHAASGSEAETPKAPCEVHIKELQTLLGMAVDTLLFPGRGAMASADWDRACLLSGRFGYPMPEPRTEDQR